MIKKDELAHPTSCLNKAADDEPVFVLRAKDVLAPTVVACWAALAMREGVHEQARIEEAMDLSKAMREWRASRVK